MSTTIQKYDGFTDRDDVARQFQVGTGNAWSKSNPFKIADDFPTDEEIIFAFYDTPDYEGYAFVLYQREGKLFEVTGYHCSCMGLEDQWIPEETTWDALAIRKPSRYGSPEAIIEEAKRHIR